MNSHPFCSPIHNDIKSRNIYFYLHLITLTIGLFTWFPFRFALVVIGAILHNVPYFILSKIYKIDTKNVDINKIQERPILPYWLKIIMVYWSQFSFRIYLYGMGIFWIKMKGKKNLTSKRPNITVVAPHTSMIDFGHVYAEQRPFYALVHKDQIKTPLFSTSGILYEVLWVDPEDAVNRKKVVESLKFRSVAKNWENYNCHFMGEGTTHNGKYLLEMKPGPFLPGLPVQPICIKMPEWITVLLYPNKKFSDRGTGWLSWCYGVSMVFNLCYSMLVPWQPCEVEILPVYYPSEDEKNDVKLWCRNFTKFFADEAGLVYLDCNKIDQLLYSYIIKKHKNLNPDKFILYSAALERKYGRKLVTKENVCRILEDYLSNPENDSIKFHEFADTWFSKLL